MSTETGRRAETEAANFLHKNGYEVLSRNWRTRVCEIDIVACKGKTIYFVEVKYRFSANHGSGLDYITKAKLKQMNFAAEVWVAGHKWTGDYQLMALEVSGENFEITNFVEAL